MGVQDGVTGKSYAVVHDAAGNVSELIDRDALALYAASAQGGGGGGQPNPALLAQAIVAHYEYDAYGNITNMTGPYAAANRIRFSDKYLDTELDWPTSLGGGLAPGGADPAGGGSGGGSGRPRACGRSRWPRATGSRCRSTRPGPADRRG